MLDLGLWRHAQLRPDRILWPLGVCLRCSHAQLWSGLWLHIDCPNRLARLHRRLRGPARLFSLLRADQRRVSGDRDTLRHTGVRAVHGADRRSRMADWRRAPEWLQRDEWHCGARLEWLQRHEGHAAADAAVVRRPPRAVPGCRFVLFGADAADVDISRP